MPMHIKLDIGASSYYSEIASIQTLDNMLKMNQIDAIQYLERIPDGYIPGRRELINELKERQRSAMEMQSAQPQKSGSGSSDVAGNSLKEEIPTGGGYSALQRKVNETGTTAGMV